MSKCHIEGHTLLGQPNEIKQKTHDKNDPKEASLGPSFEAKNGHTVARKSTEETARQAPKREHLNGNVARRRPTYKSETIWDTELPGFGLRQYPSGSKSWIVRYQQRGRSRTATLGTVKTTSARDARKMARKLLGKVALHGLELRPVRKAKKGKGRAFVNLCDVYLKHRPFEWKPLTESTNVRIIRIYLLPEFGELEVALIAKADILRWRDGMAAKGGMFNRAVPVMCGVMDHAERIGWRKTGTNPVRGTPRYQRQPKQRFLTADEYSRLHHFLDRAEADHPAKVAAIRLLMHTGARSGEIVGLRRNEVCGERLELADSKTGPKTILLSKRARAILACVPPRGHPERVFSDREGRRLALGKYWAEFRLEVGLPDVRLHDLRHSYASIAIQNGIDLEAIGRLLGHVLADTTQRYAHLDDVSVSRAANQVGSSISELMGMAS